MRRLIPFLLVVACYPCDSPPGVEQVGVAGPPGADAVLAAAGRRCDLDGLTVRWFDRDIPAPGGGYYAGLVVPVACGSRVDVRWRAPAWESALAHELAHVCGVWDEGEADAWAAAVNAEAYAASDMRRL